MPPDPDPGTQMNPDPHHCTNLSSIYVSKHLYMYITIYGARSIAIKPMTIKLNCNQRALQLNLSIYLFIYLSRSSRVQKEDDLRRKYSVDPFSKHNSKLRAYSIKVILCSLIHLFNCSFVLFVRQFVSLFVRSFVHSCTCSIVHSFIRLFVHAFICAFVYSFMHSFVHSSFVHSFIRSFVHFFIFSFFHFFIFSFFIFLFWLIIASTTIFFCLGTAGKTWGTQGNQASRYTAVQCSKIHPVSYTMPDRRRSELSSLILFYSISLSIYLFIYMVSIQRGHQLRPGYCSAAPQGGRKGQEMKRGRHLARTISRRHSNPSQQRRRSNSSPRKQHSSVLCSLFSVQC